MSPVDPEPARHDDRASATALPATHAGGRDDRLSTPDAGAGKAGDGEAGDGEAGDGEAGDGEVRRGATGPGAARSVESGKGRSIEPARGKPGAEIHRRRDYTSAVYGSVLAATVIVSSGDLRAPGVLAILLVVSGLTFWIAHVYAATVAGVHGGWHYGAIWSGMRHEWPVAFAAVPPAIAALICGLVPNISVTDGVWAALIVALAEQQFWGLAAVRHAKLTGPALTKTVLLNVFMGLVIVALKLGVNH